MQLVVLAAGKGVRLGSEAKHLPKSLVNIGRTPYLDLQLRAFSGFPFAKKFIVGGYAYQSLAAFLQEFGHTDWLLVNNPDFHKGNLYSLATVLPALTEGFFIFNADHFYAANTYKKIFAAQPEDITIFCDHDRPLGDDDMKVATVNDRLARMAKNLNTFDYGYVGVSWIPARCLNAYRAAVHATAAELGDGANVEAVMNHLAGVGQRISLADISGSWWTEIDTPEDLNRARAVIGREMGIQNNAE